MLRSASSTGRRSQLWHAMRGLHKPQPRADGGPCDPDVLALVETPYTGMADTHRRLAALHRLFESRADRRAVFLAIYTEMTGAVAEGLDDGTFVDAEWVAEYLVTFANLYREAVADYEAGRHESLAPPWQLAFEAAERGDSLVVQDAMLGVNAHINYDLALTLERVGVGPNRREKYADHHAVTDVIRSLVDEAQASMAEREADGITRLDRSLGRADEWLTVLAIDECRDSAWRTAVALHSRFPPRRRLAQWLNAATSTGVARLLLASRTSDRLHDTVAGFERSDGG